MGYNSSFTFKWCIAFVCLLQGLRTSTAVVQYACLGENVTITCPNNSVKKWQILTSYGILASCENEIPDVHPSVSVTGDCKSLSITNVSMKDVGTYRCYSGNENKNKHDIALQIKVLEIVDPPTSSVRKEGEYITLVCFLESADPAGIIRWMTTNETLRSEKGHYISYSFIAKRSDNKKIFTCTMNSSQINCIADVSVQLNLILKPKVSVITTPGPTVKQGQNITLMCQDTLNEHVNVLWKHNQKALPNKTHVLQFKNVLPIIAGEYMCTAQNTAGIDSDHVNITVSYPPVIQNRKDTYRINKSQRILKCDASGVPGVYTFNAWQHHTYDHSFIRHLDGEANGTLNLPELNTTHHLYEDGGIYTCNVSNGISDEENKLWQIGQIKVIVEEKPVVVKPKKHHAYGHFNKTSIISIFVLSSSKISNAEWSSLRTGYLEDRTCTSYISETEFHRQLVNVSGYKCELLIHQTKEEDFESYTVNISNKFGDTTFEIKLKSARAPDKPTNIRLYAGTNYIVVKFQPGFHGGSKQKFILEYRKKLTGHWISHKIKSSNEFDQSYKIEYLDPSTEFELRMLSQNKQGNSSVTKIYSKITSDEIKSSGTQYIIGFTFTLIFLVSLVVLIWWRLKKAKKKDSHRGVRENDQNEPGVVAVNNLYGSTNELNVSSASDGRTDVYSSINRREQMLDRQKVTYNIAGEGKRSQVKLTDAKQWKTNVASGSSELNYIEVEFGFEQPTGNYFIHGADNRTPYADIDFLAKAEPLISSDEDDESIAGGDDNGDDFMTLEDVQQWNITVD